MLVNGKSEDQLSKNIATKAKVPRQPAGTKAEKATAKQSPKRDSIGNEIGAKTATTPSGRIVNNATLVSSAFGTAAISMELWSFVKTTDCDLVDELRGQTEKLKKGDLTNVEEMLYCQAVTLQAVFARTLQHAITNESMKHQNTMLTLAFKAQAQCRTTLETLANIKNPRAVAFVKQANIANNQQVNNGAGEPSDANARAREKTLPIEQNELITFPKANHAETMDSRTKGSAGTGDSALEAVGSVDRPEISVG